MPDQIDRLCEEYDFNKMLKNKKTLIVAMVNLIFGAYEVFHGEPASPPIDIVKKTIRIIIEVCPESIHLRLKTSSKDVADQVLDRVVEKIYKVAERELIKRKAITYIS